MTRRAISGQIRTWLIEEMDFWQGRGILSPDQAAQITDLYETPSEIARQKRSLAQFALMGLAAVMVGLAVLLLIGYNWEQMPSPLKLFIIFGAILGTHAAGFALRYRANQHRLSEIVFFLGCLFYGAGIWLVAQVFHIPVHFPDGFWFWAIGVLPFALLLDTLLLHALLVGLLAIWVGTEVIGFNDLGPWLFGRGGMPNGAYTLPLLAVPGLLWGYRKRLPQTVALYAPLLAWWVVLQPVAWFLAWHHPPGLVYFVGGVGGLFLLIAESHRPGSAFAIPYRFFGALMAGGVLVPLSFYEFNEEVFREDLAEGGLGNSLLIVAMGIVAVVLAAALRRKFSPKQVPVEEEIVEIARKQWLPAGVILLMAFLSFWHVVVGTDAASAGTIGLHTVLANVAMVLVSLWLMHVGLRDERGVPFAAGVCYFLLWTVLRYVDLFADVGGMLGASLMFFLCGATLFGVAMFWRGRKEGRHV